MSNTTTYTVHPSGFPIIEQSEIDALIVEAAEALNGAIASGDIFGATDEIAGFPYANMADLMAGAGLWSTFESWLAAGEPVAILCVTEDSEGRPVDPFWLVQGEGINAEGETVGGTTKIS